MQRISIRLLVALITFCIGVAVAAVWIRWPATEIEPVSLSELAPPVLQSRCFPGFSEKVDELNPAAGGYFPEAPACQDVRLDRSSFFTFYTEQLKQLNEPTLLNRNETADGQIAEGQTAFRFLWLRSFHPAIAVRVWFDGEKPMLTVKKLSRLGRNESTELLIDETRTLTPKEWATFLILLDDSCFWGMPTTSNDAIAEDGAWWVFEGVQDDYYHVTHRQSPASGPYRELCLYLLKLSGLGLDEGEIY